MAPQPRRDLAQEITDIIIARIEEGVAPWKRPWRSFGGGRPRRAHGQAYTGINSLLLWAIADCQGYNSQYWMTRKQARDLGGTVRRGEPSSPSIYFNTFTKAAQPTLAGEGGSITIRFMRSYDVFNCDQITDLPAHYYPQPMTHEQAEPSQRQAAISAFFSPIPIEVRHGGNQAFYSLGGDYVQMPPKASFLTHDHHAATMAHEMAHATGAAHRLGREFGRRFGDKAYAFEELVAEITSGTICSELGLPPELHDNHASYVAGWLSILKSDKSAIITAAAKAEQAYRWLSVWSESKTREAYHVKGGIHSGGIKTQSMRKRA